MIRELTSARVIPILVGYLAMTACPGRSAAQTGAEDLRLTIGKSVVIDYPADIRQISTSNPEIADASPVTKREVLVHGKGLGSATLIVWDKSGERTFYSITVEANVDPLRRLLKETFPSEDIRVQSSRDAVSLVGVVSAPAVGERAAALAAPFGKAIVNNLQLSTPAVEKQIILKVKFAELDRTKATQFGINILSTGATNTIGGTSTGQFTAGSVNTTSRTLSVSDALNIFAFRPDLNLAAFIKALQNEAILQILAEPNLVTTNGKEASFLVGGEFPVPIVQGGSNASAVTIQFREFGIRLVFTPQITPNKTIRMHLRQEVSTVDLSNAVTLNGFTIPALSTRRAETDVELMEGQSFIVAGLMDNRDTESYSKIPGLGNLPIFGNLFKSRDKKQTRSELVMVVSPEIAHPLAPGETAPLPYFPKDFMVPLTPTPATPPVPEKIATNQAVPKSHWFGLKRFSK